MDEQLRRLAPLTGVIFVVLTFLAFSVVGSGVPGFMDPPGDYVDYFVDDSNQAVATGYLASLAIVFLLWFVGSLRSFLRQAEGGDGRVSAVAFGGGVAASALLLAAYTMAITGGLRADEDGAIDEGAATVLLDTFFTLFGVAAAFAVAVLVAATAVVIFRTRVLPVWLAWVSGLLAIGLLISPIAWMFMIGSLVWILLLSFLIYTKQRAAEPAG